jgi:hypothetical protein
MFACAHPAIDPAIRAPVILQTVLGLDAVLDAIYVAYGEARLTDEAVHLGRVTTLLLPDAPRRWDCSTSCCISRRAAWRDGDRTARTSR